MKRKLIDKLLEWKEGPDKQPILLTGGKGVGKTYLALDFAKTFYENYIYINYECRVSPWEDSDVNSISSVRILEHIAQLNSLESILLILDEVVFFVDFLDVISDLKSMSQIDILVISSLNTVNNAERFKKLDLYPLDFEEFLLAVNKEWYIGVIKEHYHSNLKIPDIVHSELLNILDIYLRVGGMPLAVNEYMNTGNEFNIPSIHKLLLNAYLSEISFDNQETRGLKVNQIIRTLPIQLGESNKKFKYSLIRKGATKNLYNDAMEYLIDSSYAIDCHKLEEATEDFLHFKLYFFDMGILHTLARIDNIKITKSLRKGLIENFVALHLRTKGRDVRYWESDSLSKIEFVIRKGDELLPIEVKADTNTRSKNLSTFRSKNHTNFEAVKISTRNFSYENHIRYVPLYAVFCI